MGKRNMEIIEFEIGGHAIKFECDSRKNPMGFVHCATLYVDGLKCNSGRIQYYNRTWEAWCYQSVCLQRCSAVIESREAQLKSEFKRDRDLSSVRGANKEELQKIIDADGYVVLMKKIKDHLNLRDRGRW